MFWFRPVFVFLVIGGYRTAFFGVHRCAAMVAGCSISGVGYHGWHVLSRVVGLVFGGRCMCFALGVSPVAVWSCLGFLVSMVVVYVVVMGWWCLKLCVAQS
jgi:hypothetical protein